MKVELRISGNEMRILEVFIEKYIFPNRKEKQSRVILLTVIILPLRNFLVTPQF